MMIAKEKNVKESIVEKENGAIKQSPITDNRSPKKQEEKTFIVVVVDFFLSSAYTRIDCVYVEFLMIVHDIGCAMCDLGHHHHRFMTRANQVQVLFPFSSLIQWKIDFPATATTKIVNPFFVTKNSYHHHYYHHSKVIGGGRYRRRRRLLVIILCKSNSKNMKK